MVRVTKLELNRTITDIMENGDLGQLTTKKIRILCEEKYQVDLTERKEEIDKIVLAYIHKTYGKGSKKVVRSGEESSGSGSGSGSGSESGSGSGSGSESESGSGSEEDSSCSGSRSCSQSDCSYNTGEESSDEETNNKRAVQNSPKAIPKKMRILGKKPAAAAATKPVAAAATKPVAAAATKPVAAAATKPVAAAAAAKPVAATAAKPVGAAAAKPIAAAAAKPVEAAADVSAKKKKRVLKPPTKKPTPTDAPTDKPWERNFPKFFRTSPSPTYPSTSFPSTSFASTGFASTSYADSSEPSTSYASTSYADISEPSTSSGKRTSKVSAAKQLEMDDAALARQLQAEEWSFRSRTVKTLFPEVPKKVEGTEEPKKKQKPKKKQEPNKKRKSEKICMLSPELAELLGATEMTQGDIIQNLWSVVRKRNLFDSNKQFALCDEQLYNLFGMKRVRLFLMMKYLKLKQHVKEIKK